MTVPRVVQRQKCRYIRGWCSNQSLQNPKSLHTFRTRPTE